MCLKDLLAVLKDLLAVPRVSAGLPAMVSPGTVLIFEVDPYCWRLDQTKLMLRISQSPCKPCRPYPLTVVDCQRCPNPLDVGAETLDLERLWN